MPLIDLSNLPSPPAGFGFAKDALGSVTGKLSPAITDSLKSASSSITAAGSKFFANLPPPPTFGADTNGPSLVDAMNSIKNGSINADITASLGNIGDIAGSLPPGVGGALDAAKAEIAEKMAAAQAELPKLMAIAQANMDLTVKLSISSTGEPPSAEQLKAASGPLAIFQDGPAMLKAQAEGISKSVAEAGAAFGAALPAGVDLAKAGLAKATDFAKSAGAAVAGFASSVPSETIPDPLNPEATIPNPAFAAFSAIPENASKLSSLSGLTGALGTAAGGLTAAFGAIEAKANAAIAGGITDLKAFAFASQLAAPASGIMAAAKGAATDLSKISPLQIAKTNQMAASMAPTTPPKNTTVDGKTEPQLLKDKDATTSANPKKAIFDKTPTDKVSESFVDILSDWADVIMGLYPTLAKTAEADFDRWYPGYAAQRIKADAIKTDKPDVADRTAEENRLVEKRAKLRAILISDGMAYQTLKLAQENANRAANVYNTVLAAFKANQRYGDVPLSVEGEFNQIKNSGEGQPKGFATFADYKAANPGVDFSWDV
jgi:hypothetical protein